MEERRTARIVRPRYVLPAAGFVVVTLLVEIRATAGVDRFGTDHLQSLSGTDWEYLTTPGDLLVASALMAAGMVVLVCQGRRRLAKTWLAVSAVAVGVEFAGKLLIDQPRTVAPDRVADLITLSGSYPSGHVLRVVLLAGMAFTLWPRIMPLLVAWSLFTAVWVVITGMHSVSDAIGGVLAGLALAAYATATTGRPRRRYAARDAPAASCLRTTPNRPA